MATSYVSLITVSPHHFHTSRSRPKKPEPYSFQLSELDRDERTSYEFLSPEERAEYQEVAKKLHEHMTSPKVQSELNAAVSQEAYDRDSLADDQEKRPRFRPGLMAMGEVDPVGTGPDDEFEGDDITSLAHGELEQHREMREYARIAAWEMPMLSSAYFSVCAISYQNIKIDDQHRTGETVFSSCNRPSPTLPIHYLHG